MEDRKKGVAYYRSKRKILIRWKGKRQTVHQWSREIGLRPHIIYRRFYMGWEPEKIFTTPVRDVKKGLPTEELKNHSVYLFILQYKRSHDGASPTQKRITKDLKETRHFTKYWVERLVESQLLYYDEDDNLSVWGGEWLPPKESDVDDYLQEQVG